MDRRTPNRSRQPTSSGNGSASAPSTSVWIIGIAAAVIVGLFAYRQMTRAPAPEAAPVVQQPPHFEPRHSAQRQAAPADSFDEAAGLPSAMVHAPRKNQLQRRSAPERVAARGVAKDTNAVPVGHDAAAVAEPGAEEPKEAEVVGTPGLGPALSVSFNGSANAADDSTPIIAQGVDFDPTLGAGRFPPNAHLAYPDRGGLDPNEGSVVFWVRMEWDPSLPIEGKSLVQMRTNAWENRFELRVAPKWIGLLLTTSDGVEQGVGTALYWAKDEWHYVGAVWGQQVMQFYIDGSLRDERDFTGNVVLAPSTPLYIGSQAGAKENQGIVSMRGLSTFPRMLSADEITQFMLATAPPPA